MLAHHHCYKNLELFSLQALKSCLKQYDTTLLCDDTTLHFQIHNLDSEVILPVSSNYFSLRKSLNYNTIRHGNWDGVKSGVFSPRQKMCTDSGLQHVQHNKKGGRETKGYLQGNKRPFTQDIKELIINFFYSI